MKTSWFFFIILKSININKTLFSTAKLCMQQSEIINAFSIYYITINNHESAVKLSNILLEKRLIACANLIGTQDTPITSLYHWQGKIENDKEILIMCKSRSNLLDEIVKEVKANHPYSVPEVIATPIMGGNPDYLKWILENTKEPETEK